MISAMSHLPTPEFRSRFDENFSPTYHDTNCHGVGPDETELTLIIKPQTKLEAVLRTINSELATLGYPTIFHVERGQPHISVDLLVQSMVRLLEAYFKDISVRDELGCRLRSIEADLAQVHKMYRRCQEELNEAQKANALAKERERRYEEEKKSLSYRLKASSDEMRRLQQNFQRHETQVLHEKRKVERELAGLRERLATSISKSKNPRSPNRRPARNRTLNTHISGLPTSTASLSEYADRPLPIVPNGQLMTRVTVHPTRTVSSCIAANVRQSKSPENRLSMNNKNGLSISEDEGTVQMDLYVNMIQKLEERQHSLLYENRELRDLVSQMSSRLVRFANYIDRNYCVLSGTLVVPVQSKSGPAIVDVECDSLDEEEEDDGVDNFAARQDSSDEEFICPPGAEGIRNGGGENNRVRHRKSANVNQLLLELPYALVRDHLTQRVRKLSRDLWRRLKRLPLPQEPAIDVRNTSTNPVPLDHRLNSTPVPSETHQPRPQTPLVEQCVSSHLPIRSESFTKDENQEQLRVEINELRSTVAEYEAKIHEQEIALRHALFTNLRRWSGYARVCGVSQEMDGEQTSTTAYSQSFNSSPQRRVSLFKIKHTSLLVDRSNEEIVSEQHDENTLPADGAGDRVVATSSRSSVDSNELCTLTTKRMPTQSADCRSDGAQTSRQDSSVRSKVMTVQRELRRKLSDADSDVTSDSSRIIPAHSTFTSSPFLTRARALSVDEEQ
ncbi:hypothetical protein P879_02358 [Paragonimus westermani]|uniref:Afadin-and alpha-actinin-binding protein n=1 Tax=Paragonimus westermani TaxID=34504 RepID=A0A8T0DK69_9TREM|nr:hypothetical protein P879_02358 [Paragonimus westermani]